MIGIAGYGCTTAAGAGVEALWSALSRGTDFALPLPGGIEAKSALWPGDRLPTARARLLDRMREAYAEARAEIDLTSLGRLGVILASTKGFVEDFIWDQNADLRRDLISPLLTDFVRAAELQPVTTAVVSNACSSSLSAIYLAQAWLKGGRVDSALIVAVDEVGPFVQKGFQVLHALTTTAARPFAAERDGLKLGEAAAVLLLSSRQPCAVQLTGVGVDAEGYAVTRPSPMGDSLRRCLSVLNGVPDLILAHGTGTRLNDEAEDQAFFGAYGDKPWISGSKWCIGHTLGASGAVDIILGCEAIRRQSAFALANTASIDPRFQSRYLQAGSTIDVAPRKVLVSSLGFGGIHAAAMVEAAS